MTWRASCASGAAKTMTTKKISAMLYDGASAGIPVQERQKLDARASEDPVFHTACSTACL
jgi:hypothetical protein